MLCPQCGYLMSALDKDCVRCRNLSVAPPAHSNASRAADSQIEWDTPPQTMAFMPMSASVPPPLNGQAFNSQPCPVPPPTTPYAPQPAYAPYPSPPVAPSEPSKGTQVLMGALARC